MTLFEIRKRPKSPKFHALAFVVFYITIIECRVNIECYFFFVWILNIFTLNICFIWCIQLQDVPPRGSLFGKIEQYYIILHAYLTMIFLYFIDLNVDTIVFDKDALQANISWKSADLRGEYRKWIYMCYVNWIIILFVQYFQGESLMYA